MAYQQNQGGFFRERLKYEDIIHNQLESYRLIRNTGDQNAIMYCVDGLYDLITPNIEDQQFLDDVEELYDEWEVEKAKMQKQHKKELQKAQGGCPDLVESPSEKPSVEWFCKKFMVANALLERKNLGLKIQTTAYD